MDARQTTFHELYSRYAEDVYRFALWLTGNPDDAKDITSETFVRAWTAPEEPRMETVKAYLFTIARNLVRCGNSSSRDVAVHAKDTSRNPRFCGELVVRVCLAPHPSAWRSEKFGHPAGEGPTRHHSRQDVPLLQAITPLALSSSDLRGRPELTRTGSPQGALARQGNRSPVE
jgi:Sigma-70 region 2